MKRFIEEHGLSVLYASMAAILISLLFSIPHIASFDKIYPENEPLINHGDNQELVNATKPILEIKTTVTLGIDEYYDYSQYIITASDSEGNDLKHLVIAYYELEVDNMLSRIDTTVPGVRTVKYVLTYDGLTTVEKQTVIVKEKGVIE